MIFYILLETGLLARGKVQVTVEQLKAARELLRWHQQDLAGRAGIGIATLRRVEGFKTGPIQGVEEITKARIVAALQGAGIRFTEHGVELIH
jgi:transcriptional regulator with XRE-family HTH domain